MSRISSCTVPAGEHVGRYKGADQIAVQKFDCLQMSTCMCMYVCMFVCVSGGGGLD
jgi:hypothetical protein